MYMITNFIMRIDMRILPRQGWPNINIFGHMTQNLFKIEINYISTN